MTLRVRSHKLPETQIRKIKTETFSYFSSTKIWKLTTKKKATYSDDSSNLKTCDQSRRRKQCQTAGASNLITRNIENTSIISCNTFLGQSCKTNY